MLVASAFALLMNLYTEIDNLHQKEYTIKQNSALEEIPLIKKWMVQIPALSGEKERRAYIYLPASYLSEPDRRYPVMYMFDGHNVFFDTDATYGKSWGMNQYMQQTQKQLIIVAVECNHEGNCRLEEYSPFDSETASLGIIKGKGKAYMTWLIKTLKPYIDANYRTLPDRKNTLICGTGQRPIIMCFSGQPVCLPAYGSIPEKFWR